MDEQHPDQAIALSLREASSTARIAIIESGPRELDTGTTIPLRNEVVDVGTDRDHLQLTTPVSAERDLRGSDKIKGILVPPLGLDDPPSTAEVRIAFAHQHLQVSSGQRLWR